MEATPVDTTQGLDSHNGPRPDRDPDGDIHPSSGWIERAVRARTIAELQDVARSARTSGDLTPRDQDWCRALSVLLADVDVAAMRELVGTLGVTGNGSHA